MLVSTAQPIRGCARVARTCEVTVPCISPGAPRTLVTRRWPLAAIVTLGAIASISRVGNTQQPAPAPLATVTEYSKPTLALVQPAPGASVPIDRPILMFRFGPGVPTDLIDARSFSVAVDGHDRSALFQVAPSEAWGPMAALTASQQPALPAGPHQVAARICSVRGLCSEVIAVVNAAPPATAATQPTPDRKSSVIDLILAAARKLLVP